MSKSQASVLFVALSAILLSLAAQSPSSETPSIVNTIRIGQIVGISEMEFGYRIRIYTPEEIEAEIEAIERHRDELITNLAKKDQAVKPVKDQTSPKEALESRSPKVDAIHEDHIVLKYTNGRERRISLQAVAEINRY